MKVFLQPFEIRAPRREGVLAIFFLLVGAIAIEPSFLLAQGKVPASSPLFMDISFDAQVAAGGSTADEEELRNLQGGAHDPKARGFTLQQGELSLLGAVDPYFTGEGHFLFFHEPEEGESGIEIEEIFFRTLALPGNLELKGGLFLTEFGIKNPQHPHFWHWLDQPVVLSRTLGGEGMRQVGLRISWIVPVPGYLEIQAGAQNARGETMPSFLGMELPPSFSQVEHTLPPLRTLVYSARARYSGDMSEEMVVQGGVSFAVGKNPLGEDAQTQLLGVDGKFLYRPLAHHRGFPFFLIQAEGIQRELRFPIPGSVERRYDRGGYMEAVYGFRRPFAVGIRAERAWQKGKITGFDPSPSRTRISPLFLLKPTEFSRIRCQYNLDEEKEGDEIGITHTLWVGLEIALGKHPAHMF